MLHLDRVDQPHVTYYTCLFDHRPPKRSRCQDLHLEQYTHAEIEAAQFLPKSSRKTTQPDVLVCAQLLHALLSSSQETTSKSNDFTSWFFLLLVLGMKLELERARHREYPHLAPCASSLHAAAYRRN